MKLLEESGVELLANPGQGMNDCVTETVKASAASFHNSTS
jgi:hypothetical protein